MCQVCCLSRQDNSITRAESTICCLASLGTEVLSLAVQCRLGDHTCVGVAKPHSAVASSKLLQAPPVQTGYLFGHLALCSS